MSSTAATARPEAGARADNDNTPKSAESFSSLAERRAYVESIPPQSRQVLAWPTLERLRHLRDNELAVRALIRWRSLNDPISLTAANDNESSADGYGVDTRREVRPRPLELLHAVRNVEFEPEIPANVRPGGRRQQVTGIRFVGGDIERDEAGQIIRLGELRFGTNPTTPHFGPGNDRAVVEWGRSRRGVPLKPIDRPAFGKGQRAPKRSETAIKAYLALGGTDWPQQYEGPAEALHVPLDRTEATENAAAELASFGVDGSVSFADARAAAGLPPIEKCPVHIHPAASWVGGITRRFKDTSASRGGLAEIAAENEHVRMASCRYVRDRLGVDMCLVLDMAITDATADEIARALGLSGSYSKKAGARIVDAAIDAFVVFNGDNF